MSGIPGSGYPAFVLQAPGTEGQKPGKESYIMEIPRVLTIAGSDSGGGAGIQADLKTITVLGGFGMSVITALTAQNTLGVHGIHEVPPDFIKAQFDAVVGDIGVDAAKIGMLASTRIMEIVAKKVQDYSIKALVLDPVMVAKGGAALIREDAIKTLKEKLIPLSLIVTPNIPEAEVLSGLKISTDDDVRQAAVKIHELGAANVLIKGGHLTGDAKDILYDGAAFHEYASPRFETSDTHGTGCTFSAAIATGLARGLDVPEAIRQAKQYITTAIKFSLRIGGGHGPTNHAAALLNESERYTCIQELKKAVYRLKQARCGNIVPEIQSNLGYALPYADSTENVAAVPGRIIRVGGDAETLHDPEFGASSHVARIILTALRYDRRCRSAMALLFSEEIVRVCNEAGFKVASFSRDDEPEDVRKREGSSLEWGTHDAITRAGYVPDVIFDRGGIGKEPIVRVLGASPDEVVSKVLRISAALKEATSQPGK